MINDRKTENGFAHIEIIAAIVIFLLIGTVAFYVHSHQVKNSKSIAVNTNKVSPGSMTSTSKPATISSTTPTSVNPATSTSQKTATYTSKPATSSTTSSTSTPAAIPSIGHSATPYQLSESFNYDPGDYPSQPLYNYCHDQDGNSVTCPADGEGLVDNNNVFSVIIPSGWSLSGAEYVYLDTNGNPVTSASNTTWNAQCNLPLDINYKGQQLTLAFILGSLTKN